MDQQKISVTSARLATPAPSARGLHSLDIAQHVGLVERSLSAESRVPRARSAGRGSELPTVSLLFAPGERSGIEQVRALSTAEPSFHVSFDPETAERPDAAPPAERWLEVLANGLFFDLKGLAPGTPRPLPPGTHRYGLPADLDCDGLEAISLRPGPHLAAGGRMLPVTCGLARLAAVLADLPGVRAVAWHPARAVSAPAHFRGSVLRWLDGGAFPGLGLTALAPTSTGGMQSEGLALFTGQELRLAPGLAQDRAAGARLALRLLHWLVEHGRVEAPVRLAGPSGEPLTLRPTGDGRFVTASRAKA